MVERLTPQEYFEREEEELRGRRVIGIPVRESVVRTPSRRRLTQRNISMVVLGVIGAIAMVTIAAIAIEASK